MRRRWILPILLLSLLCIVCTGCAAEESVKDEKPTPSTFAVETGGETLTLTVPAPDAEGMSAYALYAADGTLIAENSVHLGANGAVSRFALNAEDDILGFPGAAVMVRQSDQMVSAAYYARTEQGFVYAGEAFGYDFGGQDGDGAWAVDLDDDRRSELVTRSTYGDGASRVTVYRWSDESAAVQQSGIDWEKADAHLAELSAPLGVTAKTERYHAENNAITLGLWVDGAEQSADMPLSAAILSEWHDVE